MRFYASRWSLFLIIILHCLVFSLFAWLFLANMDIDMFENYAWGQTFEWGSFKHPPLFAWITKLWFMVWPTNHIAYFFLSYFNAAIGLWGVLALARLLFKDELKIFLIFTLGFAILGLPYNFYAAIFNADSISLSTWPWTTYAFITCIQAKHRTQKWFWTLILAVLSAASVLGKYFSVMLLFVLFIISLLEKDYRQWYKTPNPYVCLGLFCVLLLPHGLFEYQMGFPFRQYYAHYLHADSGKILKHLLTFSLTGIYFFALSWVALLFIKYYVNAGRLAPLQTSKLPHRVLLYLCVLPALITAILSIALHVSVMDRWAIPVWFALPIFMASRLMPLVASEGKIPPDPTFSKVGVKAGTGVGQVGIVLLSFWLAFLALIIVGFFYTHYYSSAYLNQYHDYAEGRWEMVNRVASQFKQLFPHQKIAWVGGAEWPDHMTPFSYYLSEHPRALPGFPDNMPALVNPYPQWAEGYGILICGKKTHDNDQLITRCVQRTKAWLADHHRAIHKTVISYHAKGWRWQYLKPPEKHVVVFWVTP